MVTNSSNKEKSLKEAVKKMKSDIWGMEKFLKLGNYLGKAEIPVSNILDRYREFFDQLLVETEVPEDFHYDPRRFSEMYYGTPDLDFLILYFSNLYTSFNFNKTSIKILPINEIPKLNNVMLSVVNEINDNRNNPPIFNELPDVIL